MLQHLLDEVQRLAFDAPEIMQLHHSITGISSFRNEAASMLAMSDAELDLEKCKTTLILGNSLNFDLPELGKLQNIVNRLEWYTRVEEDVDDRTIQYHEVLALLQEAEEYGINPAHPSVIELRRREATGKAWQGHVERVLAREVIELDDVSALIEGNDLIPTEIDTMRQLEKLRKDALTWQASALQMLNGSGSAIAAQRLVRTYTSAEGAAAKIRIPELDWLEKELDFHEQWRTALIDVLKIHPKALAATLAHALGAAQRQMAADDDEPNHNHACFCRAPPGPQMVVCKVCNGSYHPRCAGVGTKGLDSSFACKMCTSEIVCDDRPSLHELASLVSSHEWDFLILPTEFAAVEDTVELAFRYAERIFPFANPLSQAVPCKDTTLLAHLARKLFTFPLALDAVHTERNIRIIFEDWLHRRLHNAMFPQTKPRKGKLVLAAEAPGEFSCICRETPVDALITVACGRCGQGYHASCVRAPLEYVGEGSQRWLCVCCVAKGGKYYHRGVDVRVQSTGKSSFGLAERPIVCRYADEPDQLGTDIFIDYRSTINLYSMTLLTQTLAPRPDSILLECTGYVPPVIPDDYDLSVIPNANGHTGARKRKLPTQDPSASPAPSQQPPMAISNGLPRPTALGIAPIASAPTRPASLATRPSPSMPVTSSLSRTALPTLPRTILDQPGHTTQRPPWDTARPLAPVSPHLDFRPANATPPSSHTLFASTGSSNRDAFAASSLIGPSHSLPFERRVDEWQQAVVGRPA